MRDRSHLRLSTSIHLLVAALVAVAFVIAASRLTAQPVGRPKAAPRSLDDVDQLLRTAWSLRGTESSRPGGSIASAASRRPSSG